MEGRLTCLLIGVMLVLLIVGSNSTQNNVESLQSVAVDSQDESVAVISETGSEFESYRDRILDIFNMTLDNYIALNDSDKERVHTYANALWGFENGTLTEDEARVMIEPNSPGTYFEVWSPVPLISCIDATDKEFRVVFISVSPVGERITKIEAYLDRDHTLGECDPNSPTATKLTISEGFDFWDEGEPDGEGSWVAKDWCYFDVVTTSWIWNYGMTYTLTTVPASGSCIFIASVAPNYIDSWVKFYIRYEYDYFSIFPLGWVTHEPVTHEYNRYGVIFPISIEDDDTTAPLIDHDSVVAGRIVDDELVETPGILDNEIAYSIECDFTEKDNPVTDGVKVSVGGMDYYCDETQENPSDRRGFVRNDTHVVGAYKIWKYPWIASQYRLYITFLYPGANFGLGSHRVDLSVTDSDNEWEGDALPSNTVSVWFEINDDDDTPPYIGITIGSPFVSDNQILLPIEIQATDSSGINEVVVGIGTEVFAASLGYNEFPVQLGEMEVRICVFDNDNDRAHDSCVTCFVETVVVDSNPPVTSALFTGTQEENGWYTSQVTTTLDPSDDLSGVAMTYYSIDGGSWCPYTDPFVVDVDGTHTISFYSVDLAGNTEGQKDEPLNIDTNDPISSIQMAPCLDGDIAYITSSTELTITYDDALSGVAHTYYSINGDDWIEYLGAFSIDGPDDEYTVSYYSVDFAGNDEDTKQTTVYLTSLHVDSCITDGDGNLIQSFDTIFTKDKSSGDYKLVATNPGQMFCHLYITNGWPIDVGTLTIDIGIPEDFVLKGTNPIHVYLDGTDITPLCLISDCSVVVTDVPADSMIEIVIHLDYALKGNVYESLAAFGMRSYKFSTTIDGNSVVLVGTYGSSAILAASQKKTTAIAGYVLDLNGNPVFGATVELYDALGNHLGSVQTDECGFYYFIDIAEGIYIVQVTYGVTTLSQEACAVKNELTLVNFNLG